MPLLDPSSLDSAIVEALGSGKAEDIEAAFQWLHRLEQAMEQVVGGIGGLSHRGWRAQQLEPHMSGGGGITGASWELSGGPQQSPGRSILHPRHASCR